jgi:hypothetical protein
MFGILADDSDDSLAFDDLAFVADGLDRSPDFHNSFLYSLRLAIILKDKEPASG